MAEVGYSHDYRLKLDVLSHTLKCQENAILRGRLSAISLASCLGLGLGRLVFRILVPGPHLLVSGTAQVSVSDRSSAPLVLLSAYITYYRFQRRKPFCL